MTILFSEHLDDTVIIIIRLIASLLSQNKTNSDDGPSQSLIGIEVLIIGGEVFTPTKLLLEQICSVVGVSYVLGVREEDWIVFNLHFIRVISLL